MSSIDPKILNRIKKCLALASSDNPNEAATAMRQAHALMAKFGVSAHEVTMSDIGEARVKSRTMARDKPARWEMFLAGEVGKAFGCQMMMTRMLFEGKGHANEGSYVFVGLKPQAEVASYTATVLIRKCKSARQKWITEHTLGMSNKGIPGVKRTVTRMGDAFAEGWALAISKLVADFANPPEVAAVIKKHVEGITGGRGTPYRSNVTGKCGNGERFAAAHGMEAAKGERLYRPMEGQAAPLALGGARTT